MQTRRQAIAEIMLNVGIGCIGAWLISWLCIRYLTLPPSVMATTITALCTVWSIGRGYTIRRYFNRKTHDRKN